MLWTPWTWRRHLAAARAHLALANLHNDRAARLCAGLLLGAAVLGLTGCGSAGPAAPDDTQRTIIVFGDSIAADSGLAGRLAEMAETAHARSSHARSSGGTLTTLRVVDATKPGEKTAAGRQRLAQVLRGIEPGAAGAVLILEGANDYRQADLGIDTSGNLSAMASLALAAGARPFVATIPPVGPAETRPERQAWVAATNERLRLAGIANVDVHAALQAHYGPGLYVDHLHLSPAGAGILAETCWQALRAGGVL